MCNVGIKSPPVGTPISEDNFLQSVIANGPYPFKQGEEIRLVGKRFQMERDYQLLNGILNGKASRQSPAAVFMDVQTIDEGKSQLVPIPIEVQSRRVEDLTETLDFNKGVRFPRRYEDKIPATTFLHAKGNTKSLNVEKTPGMAFPGIVFLWVDVVQYYAEHAYGTYKIEGQPSEEEKVLKFVNAAARQIQSHYGNDFESFVQAEIWLFEEHEKGHILTPFYLSPLISSLERTGSGEAMRNLPDGQMEKQTQRSSINHALESLCELRRLQVILTKADLNAEQKQGLAIQMARWGIITSWNQIHNPDWRNYLFANEYWIIPAVLLSSRNLTDPERIQFDLDRVRDDLIPAAVKCIQDHLAKVDHDLRQKLANMVVAKLDPQTRQAVGKSPVIWLDESLKQRAAAIAAFDQAQNIAISRPEAERQAWTELLEEGLSLAEKTEILDYLLDDNNLALQKTLARTIGFTGNSYEEVRSEMIQRMKMER